MRNYIVLVLCVLALWVAMLIVHLGQGSYPRVRTREDDALGAFIGMVWIGYGIWVLR